MKLGFSHRGEALIFGRFWRRLRLLGVIIACLLLSALIILNSAGFILRGSASVAAMQLAAFDARARADYAELLVAQATAEAGGLAGAQLDAAANEARQAIARDLLIPDAWRILALSSISAMEPDATTLKFLEMSSFVSRRDVPTNVLLFERYAQKDRKAAFRELDLALRRSSHGREVLLPILAKGIEEADFRQLVLDAIKQDRGWRDEFFRQLGSVPLDDQVLGSFVRELSEPAVKQARSSLLLLAADLVAAGRYGSAEALATRLVDAPSFPINGDFEKEEVPPPFGWAEQSGPSYDAAVGAYGGDIDGRRALYLRASTTVPVEVARQIVFLPTGRHRIKAIAGSHEETPLQAIELAVACAEQDSSVGRLLGRITFTPVGKRKFQMVNIDVPNKGCSGQWLLVMVSGREGGSGGWIDSIGLVPESAVNGAS